MQTSISKDINDRFFQAIDHLIEIRRIRGLQTFCRAHDINRRNVQRLRHHTDLYNCNLEWLYWLSHDYGISPQWLLLGTGEMLHQVGNTTSLTE